MINCNYQTESFNRAGIINAFITASGWALVGIFVKLLANFSVITAITARLVVALVGIVGWLLLQNKLRIHLRKLLQLKVWLLGLAMLLVYVFGTLAFQLASVGEVALLAATAPIFVIVFRLIQNKPISVNEYWGGAIAFIGVCIVILSNVSLDGNISGQRLLGDISALLVSALVAAYTLCFRLLSKNGKAPSSEATALAAFILGCLVFCPIAFKLSVENGSLDLIYGKEIAAFAGLGLISTAIPTLCSATAAKKLPPLIATSISLLEPILAIIFAFIILQEVPSIWAAPGSILVLGGLFWMGIQPKSKSAIPAPLSWEQLDRLTLALKSKPKAGENWTGIQVAHWIEQETGITLIREIPSVDRNLE